VGESLPTFDSAVTFRTWKPPLRTSLAAASNENAASRSRQSIRSPAASAVGTRTSTLRALPVSPSFPADFAGNVGVRPSIHAVIAVDRHQGVSLTLG
jgi:hypothetical protein